MTYHQRIPTQHLHHRPLRRAPTHSLSDTLLVDEDSQPQAATYFGRYELIAPLGAGGMGRVFRVFDHELLEEVALKVLHRRRLERESSAAMFRREVRLARRVSHPNVVRTFEFGVHDDFPYLTMECVVGRSLAEILDGGEVLDEGQTVALLDPIAHALAAAHGVGVIHRDVKPGNVMIADDGRVMLTDFGLAKLRDDHQTFTGGTSGTPAYMAPEQIRGDQVSEACDLYALGILAYRLATGRLPFAGANSYSVALAKLHQDAPDPRRERPQLSAEFAALVRRCLMPAPTDRPASAECVARQLRVLRGGADETETVVRVELEPRPATKPAKIGIAVLPFRGADASVQVIAEGLADDLVGELSTMRRLRVISPSYVADASVDLSTSEGAERLGATMTLEATMRSLGSSLRLNIRLLRLDDGEAIWARRIDCSLAAALDLHKQLARDVAAAMSVELANEDSASAAVNDSKTLELLLLARACYQGFHLDAMSQAQAYIETALERAPEDPSVWASAALIFARTWLLERIPQPALLARARELAVAAVAAGAELGEAHLALGSVQYFAGESLDAARSLRAAVARSPSNPDAHELLGVLLLQAGLTDVGLQRLATASRMNPSLRLGRWEQARIFALRGQWSEVEAVFAAAMQIVSHPRELWVHVARYVTWRQDPEIATQLRESLDAHEGDPADGEHLDFVRNLLDIHFAGADPSPLLDLLRGLADQPGVSPHRARFCLELLAETAAQTGLLTRALGAIDDLTRLELGGALWLARCPLLAKVRGLRQMRVASELAERHKEHLLDAVWAG